MGCHTWFYKKEDLSYGNAKLAIIKKWKKDIEKYQKWIDNPYNSEYIKLLKYYPDFDIPSLIKYVEILKRQLKFIEGGYCKVAVMNKYCDFISKRVSRYVDGVGYFVEIDDFHDVFRIGNYPNDELFSMQKTLDFIEKNKDKVYFHDEEGWKNRLEEFWTKYPDGMIDFG